MRMFAFFFILILLLFSASAGAQSSSIELLSPTDTAGTQESANDLSLMSKIHVTEFRFKGNTIFSSDELGKLAAPYENREITIEDLEKLRQELSLFYVSKGYVNSGVLIPDQKMVNGIITLSVIEGTLNEIQIQGLKYFREGYIASRLEKSAAAPVNIGRLQEALQLLQEDPRIKRINAEFKPGAALGEGVLNVGIEEASPYQVFVTFDNDAPPSTGSYRGELNLVHQNLFGFGDILAATAGLTEGEQMYHGSYAIPLTATDTVLELNIRKGDSRVTESLFKDLNIESKSDTYGLRLRQPLYKTPGKEFALSLAAEARQSETFLLDRPFTFSPGAVEGKSSESVLRFSQEWLNRNQSTVLAAHSTFSLGVDAFGATVHDAEADGRFFAWLGQALLTRRLGESDSQFVFRTDLQLTNDNLLSLEKFSLGGMNSVRGYRKDLFLRDNGLNSSAEFRIPVVTNGTGIGSLLVVPFFDFGWARNNQPVSPDEECIYSIGLGFKWEPVRSVHLDVFYGYGLKEIKDKGNDLQDQGLYFQLSWQIM